MYHKLNLCTMTVTVKVQLHCNQWKNKYLPTAWLNYRHD